MHDYGDTDFSMSCLSNVLEAQPHFEKSSAAWKDIRLSTEREERRFARDPLQMRGISSLDSDVASAVSLSAFFRKVTATKGGSCKQAMCFIL